jgi:hypothetical protein
MLDAYTILTQESGYMHTLECGFSTLQFFSSVACIYKFLNINQPFEKGKKNSLMK